MKDQFTIKTLSDCAECNQNKTILRNGGNMPDPISIILGGINTILSLFGFGNQRRRLTTADWNQMFPANGPVTTAYKNYLASRIHYDVDLGNIEPFTRVYAYQLAIADPTKPSDVQKYNWLMDMLRREANPNNNQNNTQAGIFGDIGIVPLLILGGIVFSVMSSTSKKRRVSK